MELALGTAEILPYRSRSFDIIVSSYLVKYTDVEKVTDECWRVLRPGGMVIFHDFVYPENGIMQHFWNGYFSMLRMMGAFATSWKIVFDQLDDVIRESIWPEQTEKALHGRGFRKISCKYYTIGTAAVVTAIKPVST